MRYRLVYLQLVCYWAIYPDVYISTGWCDGCNSADGFYNTCKHDAKLLLYCRTLVVADAGIAQYSKVYTQLGTVCLAFLHVSINSIYLAAGKLPAEFLCQIH